jgi:hypothetical protein
MMHVSREDECPQSNGVARNVQAKKKKGENRASGPQGLSEPHAKAQRRKGRIIGLGRRKCGVRGSLDLRPVALLIAEG